MDPSLSPKVNQLTNLDLNVHDVGTPKPLIQWKNAFRNTFYSDWKPNRYISSDKIRNDFETTDEKWNNIGILYGGGKESLLSLALLREYTKSTIHIIMMGHQWESNELLRRLRLMKRIKNYKIHIAYLNNPDRTWAQIVGCLPICKKHKIGTIFFGAEGDYHAFNESKKEVSQYMTCGVPMNKFASECSHKSGFPVTFTSLVYPLSAWNSMYVLKEKYPDLIPHMMCYKPTWSQDKRFSRPKSGGSVKVIRSILYAESMGIKIDSHQSFVINDLIPRLFSNSEYLDDYSNHCSYVPYSLEAKHSMYRLGILPDHAQEYKWIESPYKNFKQYIPEGYEFLWDVYCENSLKAPVKVGNIYRNVTLDSVNKSTKLILDSVNRSIFQ